MIAQLFGRGIGFFPGGSGYLERLGLSPGAVPSPAAKGPSFQWEDLHLNRVFSNYYATQELLNLIAGAPVATGLLNGAKLGLFQGAPTLSGTMVPADFLASGVLPTYTGYAVKTVAWDAAPIRTPSGAFAVHGEVSAPFAPTDAVTPNTITGAYMTDSAGTHVLWAEYFDTPLNFLDQYSFCSPDLYLGSAPTGDQDIIGGS
jgi:hypothetical protein